MSYERWAGPETGNEVYRRHLRDEREILTRAALSETARNLENSAFRSMAAYSVPSGGMNLSELVTDDDVESEEADLDEPELDDADAGDAELDEAEVDDAEVDVDASSESDEERGAELDRILSDHLVTMMYQPITSLLDDSVVGYEALARGPEDSPLAAPADMFATAESDGRLKELDLLCQNQAVVQARDVLLKSGHALFVNIESSVLVDAALGRDADAAESVSSLLANITAACPVVLEISERYAYQSPADLLAVTGWARAQGFRVALDDVDVGSNSLAILPLIEPDVIKLARGILGATPDEELGLLLRVVRGQSERTGAAVVCQGIESDADRELALSFGATHVQGFAVGHPEELSEAPIRIRSLEPVGASWGEPCATPFELVANSSQIRTGNEELMLALTLDLERQAADNEHACLLSCFEHTVTAPPKSATGIAACPSRSTSLLRSATTSAPARGSSTVRSNPRMRCAVSGRLLSSRHSSLLPCWPELRAAMSATGAMRLRSCTTVAR